MTRGITHLEAIETVLRESDRPMRAKEIVREIHQRHLSTVTGNTPLKTINARISADIKRKGRSSRFMRVGRGLYTLRGKAEQEYLARPHGRRLSVLDQVLVFPATFVGDIGHFHGIRRDYEKYTRALLTSDKSFFVPRVEAERTSDYKQIVGYAMITRGDSILRFTRGAISNVGEYLDGEYSIGFGGHVEERSDYLPLFPPDDFGYAQSVVRELSEEIGLSISTNSAIDSIVGVLNDDSSELGRRHFAILHRIEVAEPEFEKGEMSVGDLRFIPIDELADEFGGYEYWSKLCVQTFFGNRISISSYVQPVQDFSLRSQAQNILVVGYIGSGKTEACTLLEGEFGYTVIRVSRIMQKIIGCGSIEEIGRSGLQKEGLSFIKAEGSHRKLAHGILDFMRAHPGQKIAIDGLRYPQTFHALRSLSDEPISVIYIDNTIDNLFKYYQDRDSSDASFTQFLDIVHHPVERDIERFRPIADVLVYNHGSLDSYIREMRDYFLSELER